MCSVHDPDFNWNSCCDTSCMVEYLIELGFEQQQQHQQQKSKPQRVENTNRHSEKYEWCLIHIHLAHKKVAFTWNALRSIDVSYFAKWNVCNGLTAIKHENISVNCKFQRAKWKKNRARRAHTHTQPRINRTVLNWIERPSKMYL